MISQKTLFVKQAVLQCVSGLQERVVFQLTQVQKLCLVLLAVAIAGLITLGICKLSDNGNLAVLKQHVFGQVHLSTGTYSARSRYELNELSWQNGLDILGALDKVNENIQAISRLQAGSPIDEGQLIESQHLLGASVSQMNALLKDRSEIQKSAHLLKANQLYTPEYQEYLHDTLAKLANVEAKSRISQKIVKNESF